MYVDILCCPKCGHELYVTALYDPFEFRYECRNPDCDYGKEYSSDGVENNKKKNNKEKNE